MQHAVAHLMDIWLLRYRAHLLFLWNIFCIKMHDKILKSTCILCTNWLILVCMIVMVLALFNKTNFKIDRFRCVKLVFFSQTATLCFNTTLSCLVLSQTAEAVAKPIQSWACSFLWLRKVPINELKYYLYICSHWMLNLYAHKRCTRFCFAGFCCCYIVIRSGLMWYVYLNSLGLLRWYRNNRKIVATAVKQSWKI